MGVIYKITNLVNGKVYIGQTTKTMERRWNSHKRDAARGIKYPIYNAMRKYGIDKFEISEIARATTRDELDAMEQEYIQKYNSVVPDGYNLRLGGNHSGFGEETRKRMSESHRKGVIADEILRRHSEAMKGNKLRLGIKFSEEERKRLSECHRRENLSEETRLKMSMAARGKRVVFTTEHRKHMSEGQKRRQANLRKRATEIAQSTMFPEMDTNESAS